MRRYGFHGLSYEYIAGRLRERRAGPGAGRVIAAHLGNGASLCAHAARPQRRHHHGLHRARRPGDGNALRHLDPGVILYLEQERGLTAKQVEDLLYQRSGLLGVSGGIASDMRTLLASARSAREGGDRTLRLPDRPGDRRPDELARRARWPSLHRRHRRACAGDPRDGLRAARLARRRSRSRTQTPGTRRSISTPESRVEVRVIPTDEEAMIARHTLDTIKRGARVESDQHPWFAPGR